jgi:hypothetical protein
MTRQTELRVRSTLDSIAREHEGDMAGNMQAQHIAEWIRSASPEEQESIRDALLDDIRVALPERAYWISLGALELDAAPRVASELEKLARSAAGRSQWRDQIIRTLASMGHRAGLDLYLEALDAGREFMGDQGLLRVHLIRVDPDMALEYGAQYLAEGFSQPLEFRRCAASSVESFVHEYSRVDPRRAIKLAERVTGLSAAAGLQVISVMVNDCKYYLPPVIRAVLKLLRGDIESSLTAQKDGPPDA